MRTSDPHWCSTTCIIRWYCLSRSNTIHHIIKKNTMHHGASNVVYQKKILGDTTLSRSDTMQRTIKKVMNQDMQRTTKYPCLSSFTCYYKIEYILGISLYQVTDTCFGVSHFSQSVEYKSNSTLLPRSDISNSSTPPALVSSVRLGSAISGFGWLFCPAIGCLFGQTGLFTGCLHASVPAVQLKTQ